MRRAGPVDDLHRAPIEALSRRCRLDQSSCQSSSAGLSVGHRECVACARTRTRCPALGRLAESIPEAEGDGDLAWSSVESREASLGTGVCAIDLDDWIPGMMRVNLDEQFLVGRARMHQLVARKPL